MSIATAGVLMTVVLVCHLSCRTFINVWNVSKVHDQLLSFQEILVNIQRRLNDANN